jgi:serine/threonine protein phosphatase PrpC
MSMVSFIAKKWKEVFEQARMQSGGERIEPSEAWIRERVHVAIGEEALQSDIDEIYRQWSLSLAPSSSPYQVCDEPTVRLSTGEAENGRPVVDRTFEVQQHSDRAPSLPVGWLSHPGIKRWNHPNEDSLFAVLGTRTHCAQPQPFGLFIVADGVGGYTHGQEASRLAIQAMIDRVLPKVFGNSELYDADVGQLLIDGVQAANWTIHQRKKEHRAAMGTTITAALLVGLTAFVVNVGDSRTYLYQQREGLRRVTQDHSVVAYLVEAGIIRPDDIYTHPLRNRIYRCLGTEPVIQVDSFIEHLQPDDTLLLCSDGLWGMVRDPRILQILRHEADPSQMSQALIEAALEGGGSDNISVIVMQVTNAARYTDAMGLQLLAKPETVELPNLSYSEPKQS